MGMQGWRKSMEDAHIAHLDLPGGVAVFGVFDGHGGKSIKKSVSKSISLDFTGRSLGSDGSCGGSWRC